MKKCPSCQRTFEDSLRFCQNDGTELIDDVDPFKTMVAGQPPPLAEDEPLQIPDLDPMKTAVFSADDQAEVLSTPDPFASLPQPEPETFSPPPPPDSYSPPPISPPDYQPIPPPPSFAEPEQIYQSPFDSPFSSAPPTQQMSPPDWNAPPAPAPQWQDQGNFGANTPFQPPGAAQGEKKGLAIASMVCGILSCLCCISILTGPAAVIMGFMARSKATSDPMNYGGSGMAMAGIITGIIGGLFGTLFLILQLIGALANARF
jgi:hypothetical protein